jgi:hypothetical protein
VELVSPANGPPTAEDQHLVPAEDASPVSFAQRS